MIRIDNWSVGYVDPSLYMAPEIVSVCLYGIALNHPRLGSTAVRTTRIVSVKGRMVTTASGSVYYLGKIDPKYRKHLREIRPNWNWRKPITML